MSAADTLGTHTADWHTPGWLVELVSTSLGGIGLDPCADAEHRVPALQHFTVKEDGLAQRWAAESVFVNPPYSRGLIQKWVVMFFSQYACGNFQRGWLLLPNDTDTTWFRGIWKQADAVVFLYGRVQFEAGAGQVVSSNRGGSVLAYVGDSIRARVLPMVPYGKVLILGGKEVNG